jgi:hypothetical protein
MGWDGIRLGLGESTSVLETKKNKHTYKKKERKKKQKASGHDNNISEKSEWSNGIRTHMQTSVIATIIQVGKLFGRRCLVPDHDVVFTAQLLLGNFKGHSRMMALGWHGQPST